MSQTSLLLKEFKKAGNKGLTNHHIANGLRILRYSARIADLRKEGYSIYCEQQRSRFTHRMTGTFKYYLIGDPDDK